LKKLFIVLFILLAVLRIAGHSLFHAGTAQQPVSHHVHQTYARSAIFIL
jgi:hypothetical protein